MHSQHPNPPWAMRGLYIACGIVVVGNTGEGYYQRRRFASTAIYMNRA